MSDTKTWHALSTDEVAALLRSNVADGLSADEAQERLRSVGPNELPQPGTRSPFLEFLDQLRAPLVVVLIVSAAVTIVLGSFVDASVIIGVVLLNAIIGFVQERKAVNALAALSRGIATTTSVMREGRMHGLYATALVPGDLILVEAGDRVPADARVIRSRDLRVDESALTGESLPVEKSSSRLPDSTVLADRANMVYASTIVVAGSAWCMVVATGAEMEIGRISGLLSQVASLTTPLTRTIARFSNVLLWGIVALAIMTFAVGLLRGQTILDMVLAAVALAVGAIPEGLPAAVTIILAIGVSRLARRKAIIRKLPAVETLGATTVICSDKTGTLTENQMTVTRVLTSHGSYTVTGAGFSPEGEIVPDDVPQSPDAEDLALTHLFMAGSLCGTASIVNNEGTWTAVGDPTEAALVTLSAKGGVDKHAAAREHPLLDMIPFSSERRFMATLHQVGRTRRVYLKGSVESILSRCTTEMSPDGGRERLQADAVLQNLQELSELGMRVLAVAFRDLDAETGSLQSHDVSSDCCFIGIVAMIDPPRQEVQGALQTCRKASIDVKMITGDHVATARYIARQLGIGDPLTGSLTSYTGEDLEVMSEGQIEHAALDGHVFARVSPAQKLQIVGALQEHGHVVAMTGDGVNDAPALRKADIGIAMGRSGTDVAQDAADLVLTDDNFVTIVNAVQEGRIVFDNIRKFIVWSLPTNIGEGLVILAAIALGITLPVLPIQILWINMTTAVILGLPLAFEPERTNVMLRKPRDPKAPLLPAPYVIRTFMVGLFLLLGAFAVFSFELDSGAGIEHARTAAANALVMMEAFYLFNVRMLDHAGQRGKRASNPVLWVGVGITLMLQVLFTYAPFMQQVFHTAAVDPSSWIIAIGAGLLVTVLIEIEKFLRYRFAGTGSEDTMTSARQ